MDCIFSRKKRIWPLFPWHLWPWDYYNSHNPANIYLFKVNNGSTRTMCEVCSKVTTKTPVSLLKILKRFHTLLSCFHCWLWISNCLLEKLNFRQHCFFRSSIWEKYPSQITKFIFNKSIIVLFFCNGMAYSKEIFQFCINLFPNIFIKRISYQGLHPGHFPLALSFTSLSLQVRLIRSFSFQKLTL